PESLSFDYLIAWILATNIFLALFNLIPALPLDGGRILRSVLLMLVSRARTALMMKIVGFTCAGIIALISIVTQDFFLLFVALLIAVASANPFPENIAAESPAEATSQQPDTSAGLTAEAPALQMVTPRENRYKTGPLPESHLEGHKQPVTQNAPTASGAIAVEVFAVLNLILAGLTFIIWVLICAVLLYDFFSSEIDATTVIAVSLIILLPGLIYFLLLLLSGIGLMRRNVWGYYVHLAVAILMALTIVGLVYAVPALIFMSKPAFRARFFRHQSHQTLSLSE
ncbi:site-2 protease family protein, partial [Roseiflexus sp.]